MPTPCMACARRCSNATSTSRHWRCCWARSRPSANCSMHRRGKPSPMADALREQQYALAHHVRDPAANAPPPGIEDRRLAIYRDLFLNGIESLLAGNFPVIRRTLGDDAWRALVRRFYAEHRCRTPLFTEVGREFVQYLEGRDEVPPWLHELAHYEWVELALQISDEPLPPHDPAGDVLAGKPVLSPHAWALAYSWPVPRIGPDFQPGTMP